MRFFRGFFPNLTAALAAALIVVAILNDFNPRMGFLQGKPALVLICLCCLCSIVCAVTVYVDWRRGK